MRNNIARRRDPLSSHLAADAITKSSVRYTQRKMILAVLRNAGGYTSAELARMCGEDGYIFARR